MAAASDVGEPSPLKAADFSGPLTPLPVPQRPFGTKLQGLAAAYRRAGLGFWAQEPPPAEVSLWDLACSCSGNLLPAMQDGSTCSPCLTVAAFTAASLRCCFLLLAGCGPW